MELKAASKALAARIARDHATSGDDPGDPYLPTAGNHGYRVARYELDLTYKMSSNNLRGEAVITATATETPTGASDAKSDEKPLGGRFVAATANYLDERTSLSGLVKELGRKIALHVAARNRVSGTARRCP